MFTQEDVDMIAGELPPSAVGEIARKTKISRPTIYRFLNGERIRTRYQEQIYLAALKIIEHDRNRTQKIKELRTQILNKPA
ncbi:MAG: hypothetical protein JST26_05775 [Bacteroidetes bacterium]|nr:hypothetical protein [Bacteroidota bacterium]